MSIADYEKAYKLGKKEYQQCMAQGENPTLLALDDILPSKGSYSEISLGLVQIPLEKIVGTKTSGRGNAFARNFMPILNQDSEFAQKWAALSTSHVEIGIHEPIKAYEYMNQFFVEEGNKRVSVTKFFKGISIPGIVTRILPKRTNDKENKMYYEFLDFYELSKINYLSFSKEGSYEKLQQLVGKAPDGIWSDDDRMDFHSIYYRFKKEYDDKNTDFSITTGDAFLTFIELHGYENVCNFSSDELRKMIQKTWEEFRLLDDDENIELMLTPTEKPSLLGKLHLFGTPKLKIAFLYEKTPHASAWTYSHELGRLHLEQTFPDEVETLYYENVTMDNVETYIEAAIKENCNIVFTTTPAFAQASVKAAIDHPQVKFLNCSVNTSHRYIRTYYIRMHEAKFLMGAIAGAMAENNKITYIADYPLYGTIAHINAFALGAKMINPRAKIHLDWRCLKDNDVIENLHQLSPSCFSTRDMLMPDEDLRYFGIYQMEDDNMQNLAMPLLHWGKFYEQLIRAIMDGSWEHDDNSSSNKAINYWWGMTSGVVDVLFSRNLPIGTQRLIDVLRKTIMNDEFHIFSGVLYSQDGMVQSDPNYVLTPDEIINMDWLADNIIGHIPSKEELIESAIPVYLQQGIDRKG